jgi:hypothetical protein
VNVFLKGVSSALRKQCNHYGTGDTSVQRETKYLNCYSFIKLIDVRSCNYTRLEGLHPLHDVALGLHNALLIHLFQHDALLAINHAMFGCAMCGCMLCDASCM